MGGTKRIYERGVFERLNVTRIFGTRLRPDLPAGQACFAPRRTFAYSSKATVTFRGVSLHIALPRGSRRAQCGSALRDGAEVTLAQAETGRAHGASLRAPCGRSVCDAVADETRVEGSLRVFSDENVQASAQLDYGGFQKIIRKNRRNQCSNRRFCLIIFWKSHP